MPPKVATVFVVVSGGRTTEGGSPPGGREAADGGSPGREPTTAEDAVAVVVDIPINYATDGLAIMNDRNVYRRGCAEELFEW